MSYFKNFAIFALALSISSFSLAYVRGGRVLVGSANGGNISELKWPSDVDEYVNRLEKCYYIKNKQGSWNNDGERLQQEKAMRCSYLADDSRRMTSQYYANKNILEYIRNKEANYPF
jgi:hypothetical protein